MARPKIGNSASETELDKVEKQFNEFDANVKALTLDRMNEAPKRDLRPQSEFSQKQLDNTKDFYLKPVKTIACSPKDKFNEKFRASYDFDKEYVHFVAENHEIIGETIDIWTRPYPGLAAEEWKVPVNKPVWGPRYLAEQIKRKSYSRLKMDESQQASSDGTGRYYGQMAVDEQIQRLDARPASTGKRSVFMGNTNFLTQAA